IFSSSSLPPPPTSTLFPYTTLFRSRLAPGAPVGGAVELALTLDSDRGAAARAGSVGAAVDPQAAAGRRVTPSGDAVRAGGVGVVAQQTAGRIDHSVELVIREAGDVCPRIQRFDKED